MEVSGRTASALLSTLLLFTLPVLFTLNALFELSALREIYQQDYPKFLGLTLTKLLLNAHYFTYFC